MVINVSIVIFIVTIFLIPAFHLKISYCGTTATTLPVIGILIMISYHNYNDYNDQLLYEDQL